MFGRDEDQLITSRVEFNSVRQRLKDARVRAGFSSALDAVRQFGWIQSTYLGHENGSRGIKAAMARQYAKAFGISLDWLLLGKATSAAEQTALIDPGLFVDWQRLSTHSRKLLVKIARVLADWEQD